ncbi:MAG: hypothetical protein KAX16_00640, partial [Actinomycetia bacterium]|nr:hypothetical protein [Actinomycetes bacterium]
YARPEGFEPPTLGLENLLGCLPLVSGISRFMPLTVEINSVVYTAFVGSCQLWSFSCAHVCAEISACSVA